ncbi:hypothetical protein K8S19_00640 [bacterium]|nr:hypothetical protein [bacterium]
MVKEVAIFKLKSDVQEEALQLFENYAAFKRTCPGCRTACVNPMVKDPTLPYLDHASILIYAEYDDLKCLAECTHALQAHFQFHKMPFQDMLVGPPVYGIFEA